MSTVRDENADASLPPLPERPKDWDRVDEASWQSFPASDPPSSWAGTDRPPALPSRAHAASRSHSRWQLDAQRLLERWTGSAASSLLRATAKVIGSARSWAAQRRERAAR